MDTVEIIQADLSDPHHQDAVLEMMNAYAADQMGDGKPLSEFAHANLIDGLRNHPTTLIFLAMRQGVATGIATCFRGFSTFAALPLIHVSDFFVAPQARGMGIGRELLESVEREARTETQPPQRPACLEPMC